MVDPKKNKKKKKGINFIVLIKCAYASWSAPEAQKTSPTQNYF